MPVAAVRDGNQKLDPSGSEALEEPTSDTRMNVTDGAAPELNGKINNPWQIRESACRPAKVARGRATLGCAEAMKRRKTDDEADAGIEFFDELTQLLSADAVSDGNATPPMPLPPSACETRLGAKVTALLATQRRGVPMPGDLWTCGCPGSDIARSAASPTAPMLCPASALATPASGSASSEHAAPSLPSSLGPLAPTLRTPAPASAANASPSSHRDTDSAPPRAPPLPPPRPPPKPKRSATQPTAGTPAGTFTSTLFAGTKVMVLHGGRAMGKVAVSSTALLTTARPTRWIRPYWIHLPLLDPPHACRWHRLGTTRPVKAQLLEGLVVKHGGKVARALSDQPSYLVTALRDKAKILAELGAPGGLPGGVSVQPPEWLSDSVASRRLLPDDAMPVLSPSRASASPLARPDHPRAWAQPSTQPQPHTQPWSLSSPATPDRPGPGPALISPGGALDPAVKPEPSTSNLATLAAMPMPARAQSQAECGQGDWPITSMRTLPAQSSPSRRRFEDLLPEVRTEDLTTHELGTLHQRTGMLPVFFGNHSKDDIGIVKPPPCPASKEELSTPDNPPANAQKLSSGSDSLLVSPIPEATPPTPEWRPMRPSGSHSPMPSPPSPLPAFAPSPAITAVSGGGRAGPAEYINPAASDRDLHRVRSAQQRNAFACMKGGHEGLDLDDLALVKQENGVDPGACTPSPPTPSDAQQHNQPIIDELEKLRKIYDQTGDKWRVYSYSKAIGQIKRMQQRITCKEDVSQVPGIGPKIVEKIAEILATGTSRYFSTVVSYLQEFGRIWGVGPAAATKFISMGITSLAELAKQKHLLTKQQQIGLKLVEEIDERMPRAEVAVIEKIITEEAAAVSGNLVCVTCGSYRRGKPTSGDVDILIHDKTGASHKGLLQILCQRLHSRGFLTDDLSTSHKAAKIDIKIYPKTQFPFALLYFTGSDHFNRSMRLFCHPKGLSLSDTGLVPVIRIGKDVVHEGNPIPCETEHDIFSALGLEYKEPWQRNI
eukprot:gene8878-223_t